MKVVFVLVEVYLKKPVLSIALILGIPKLKQNKKTLGLVHFLPRSLIESISLRSEALYLKFESLLRDSSVSPYTLTLEYLSWVILFYWYFSNW